MLPEKIHTLYGEFPFLKEIKHPNNVYSIKIERMKSDLPLEEALWKGDGAVYEHKYYFCSPGGVVGLVGGTWPRIPFSLFNPATWFANKLHQETVWEGMKRLGDIAGVVSYIVFEPYFQPGTLTVYKLPHGMRSLAQWRSALLADATRA